MTAPSPEVLRFVRLLREPGDVGELRVLKHNKYGHTAAGWFDDPEKLAAAAMTWDGKVSIFVTLNPVDPALLGWGNNRMEDHAEHTTADAHVLRRRWLPVDVDPVRLSGISSTNAETETARAVVDATVALTTEAGWPQPVIAMSGNGWYALYRIDLPNDAESTALVDGVLKALAARCDTPAAHIDPTVSNASRLVGLIGTVKKKGDALPDRPHRRSHLIAVPDVLVPVPVERLRALVGANAAPHAAPAAEAGAGAGEGRLAALLRHNGHDFRQQPPDANGITWYHVHRCPFHEDGADYECGVGQKLPDGAMAGHCFHPEGKEKHWQDWKQALGLDLRPRGDGVSGDTRHPYGVEGSGLVLYKDTPHGEVTVPLTNFTAHIVGQVLEDDGAEEHLLFEIEAVHRGRKVAFTIPSSTFGGMQWPLQYLGADAVVHAGATTKDHARAAVQFLSGEVPLRRTYAHTGWRTVDGEHLYLHAGGAIGADGYHGEVEVHLTGNLAKVELPAPPDGEDLRAAVRASLDLLSLGPLAITAPVLAAVYLAPLREFLGPDRYDLLPWLLGDSGAFKSEVAALGQAHYGPFTRQTLPANFLATANALEGVLFRAKDILLVVDDFYPETDRLRAQAMAAVASRLARGVGNGAARARMRADTSLRPDMPPRGLALATGELLPDGYSSVARLFQVPVMQGAINRERLTLAQQQTWLYPLAMAGYLRWLAQQSAALADSLSPTFRRYRDEALREKGHAREPGQVAHLFLGIDTFFCFATEVGVLTEAQHKEWRDAAWRTLLELAASQRRDVADQHPVRRFLALLQNGFTGRTAFLEAPSGGAPPDGTKWGWMEETVMTRDGPDLVTRHPPSATYLGWVDQHWLYLIPEATHQFIVAAAAKSGQAFPTGQKVLLKQLEARGLIAVETEADGNVRRTVKVRRGAESLRVIKLSRGLPDPQGRQGATGAGVPDLAGGAEIGNTIGNSSERDLGTDLDEIPDVPDVPADRAGAGERTEGSTNGPANAELRGVLSPLGEHREQREQSLSSVPERGRNLFPIRSEDREHETKIGNTGSSGWRVEV